MASRRAKVLLRLHSVLQSRGSKLRLELQKHVEARQTFRSDKEASSEVSENNLDSLAHSQNEIRKRKDTTEEVSDVRDIMLDDLGLELDWLSKEDPFQVALSPFSQKKI